MSPGRANALIRRVSRDTSFVEFLAFVVPFFYVLSRLSFRIRCLGENCSQEHDSMLAIRIHLIVKDLCAISRLFDCPKRHTLHTKHIVCRHTLHTIHTTDAAYFKYKYGENRRRLRRDTNPCSFPVHGLRLGEPLALGHVDFSRLEGKTLPEEGGDGPSEPQGCVILFIQV